MKTKAILITALLCAFAGTAHAQWDGNGTSAQGIVTWAGLQASFDDASTDANNPTTITLAGNVTASGSDSYLLLSGNRHVVLDLNGHTLSRGLTAATSNGYVIGMANGSLTIRDSGTGGTITGGYNTGNIGCIAVSTNATLTLESGTISGNRITNQGGSAINCSGTVYMTGGTITGNTANTGRDGYEASDLNMCGAIYFSGSSGAALYMSGGAITGNRCGRTTAGAAGITSHLGIGSASVHLSGNYNISGNEQGTYNRATGEWTDLSPSDIHNSPRLGIRIDGPVSPAAPARLILNGSTGGHRETFTSGWSTYMGSADPEDYFTLDPASGFGIGIVGGEAQVGTLHTITLHGGLTASVTSAAQGKSVTLGGITYATDYIVSYNDGTTDHADLYAADAQGNATFLMPDADVTVGDTVGSTVVAYIDEDGSEKTVLAAILTGRENILSDGWYVAVGNVSFNDVVFLGDGVNSNAVHVRIILADGATLSSGTSESPLQVHNAVGYNIVGESGIMSIYGQANGTGALAMYSDNGILQIQTVNIYGGHVTFRGGGNWTYTPAISAQNGITIKGGTVHATGGGGGISSLTGTITLGWRSAADRIYANKYNGSVIIASGQYLYNGTEVIGGDVTDLTKVNDKTLQPAVKITLPTGVTAYGTDVFNQTDGTYALPGTTVTLGAATGYAISECSSSDVAITKTEGVYSFTMPATDVTVTLTPGLSLNAAKVLGEDKYVTTFYNSQLNYQLPEGALAYTAGLDGTQVVFYRIGENSNVIPAGTAVVIVANAASVSLTKLDSEPGVTPHAGNILQGADTDIATPTGTVYVLGAVGEPAVLGFYKYTGTTIPAGKAYYVVNE